MCDKDAIYINKTFAKFGLEIYNKTPNIGLYAERYDEVKTWLNNSQEVVENLNSQ